MRQTPTVFRCPYCCLPLGGVGGRPLLPGALVVCEGCTGPSAFDPNGGERLVALGPGELTSDVASAVYAEQQAVRERHAKTGGCPAGFRWGRGALCESCWEEFSPGKEACRACVDIASPCAFCGRPTRSGIYRRMLRLEDGSVH